MSRYKAEVEECRILDINVLKEVCKRGGDSGQYRWWYYDKIYARVGYSIRMTTRGNGILTLDYKIPDRLSGEEQVFNYPILLTSTKCNYGGLRYWMLCPLVRDGKKCYRRVSKLYLTPGGMYFGCRECLRLTYESKFKNYRRPMFRYMNRLFKCIELEEKTKRMTYNGKLTRNARKLIALERTL